MGAVEKTCSKWRPYYRTSPRDDDYLALFIKTNNIHKVLFRKLFVRVFQKVGGRKGSKKKNDGAKIVVVFRNKGTKVII